MATVHWSLTFGSDYNTGPSIDFPESGNSISGQLPYGCFCKLGFLFVGVLVLRSILGPLILQTSIYCRGLNTTTNITVPYSKQAIVSDTSWIPQYDVGNVETLHRGLLLWHDALRQRIMPLKQSCLSTLGEACAGIVKWWGNAKLCTHLIAHCSLMLSCPAYRFRTPG